MAFSRASRRTLLVVTAVAGLVGLLTVVLLWRADPVPSPGTDRYEQVTRAFYVGLAALEVGLLEDADRNFAWATQLAPGEPAAFANLGLARLRLGDLEGAVAPIERAVLLAPEEGRVAVLSARLETSLGRIEGGIAELRRAVAVEPGNVRARFALAEEIERSAAPGADEEAQALVDAITDERPDNVAALLERVRLAAKRGDLAHLRDSAGRLEPPASGWPPLAMEQRAVLGEAVADGDLAGAARGAALLRNVLAPVPAFQESLAALRTPVELIAEPIEHYLAMLPVPIAPDPPDRALRFEADALGPDESGADIVVPFFAELEADPAWLAAGGGIVRELGTDRTWPFPGTATAQGLLALDWTNDFRTDLLLAGSDGVRLLVQDAAGELVDATAEASVHATVACDCTGAWAADVEMDGDIDVVLGVRDDDPLVLRNRGDGTWDAVAMFDGVRGARAFVWADLDQDADPDAAFLDAEGALHVFVNRQAGVFTRVAPPPGASGLRALTVGDVNADGRLDLVALDASGAVRRWTLRGDTTGSMDALAWDEATLGTWAEAAAYPADAAFRLFVADLDNNGALDIVASGPGVAGVWLADEAHAFEPLAVEAVAQVHAVLDTDGDGRLDLVGVEAGRPVRWLGRGEAAYHWKTLRVRAQAVAGDQRINAWGIGGDVEIRSGLLAQKQVLTGAPLHFGLGHRSAIDVARIVWPNGVAQAEFDLAVDDTLVAEQRLKGSCPWVFAWNGQRVEFVTDFLWRSPLGLRINAQDTAGVAQTEDWIRIGRDQLVARDGIYDVRITAELWETHYFDHVSLMTVDAPGDLEVFVDERFSAARPQALAVQAVGRIRPVAGVWNEAGREVTDLVARRDGRYLAPFRLGAYQGIAEEHTVEIALDAPVPADTPTVLVAHGWVYPTDSSINVAIGQGGHVSPIGLALEAQNPDGRWFVVDPDLGFPAGKHKTMLIDLGGAHGASRLRLRTNLEISWDWLAIADRVDDVPLRQTRLQASRAELCFRGFSETISPRGEAPETPLYDRIATTAQRWRDLTGYYTRFGDVRELLAEVDDRYVIMNAGDELQLEFEAPPPPPPGWRRDFVLIGDGWEKDGDYNTEFSQTVLPLPSHDDPAYTGGPDPLVLEASPVYQRHRDDWERFHTRYVTPRAFVRGVRGTD